MSGPVSYAARDFDPAKLAAQKDGQRISLCIPAKDEEATVGLLVRAVARDLVERVIADEFVFSAPPDVGIDRATYFERCWPNAGHVATFEYVRLRETGPDGAGQQPPGEEACNLLPRRPAVCSTPAMQPSQYCKYHTAATSGAAGTGLASCCCPVRSNFEP